MAQEVTPPDMVGAGVAAPQGTNASSLMAQLRQGGLPGDMAGLGAMPQQTPGQSYASALAGGVAQMQGQPNPIAGMQQQGYQQSLQRAQMVQNIMNQRIQREENREKVVLDISKDLMNSVSPEARMVGARGVLNFVQKNGMPVQEIEPLIKAMTTRTVDINALMKDIELGLDDPTLYLRYRDLDPKTLQAARMNIKNDAARRVVGLKTTAESQKEIFDLKKAEADAMDADFPGIKGKPELQLMIDQEHRRVNAGKGYREGTPESRLAAFDTAYAQSKAAEQEKIAIQQAAEARKAAAAENFNKILMGVLRGGQGQPGQPSGGIGGPLSPFEVSPSITPSGGSINLTPRKPLSGEAMMQVSGIGGLRDAINRVDAIRADPKLRASVEDYIGPAAQFKITFQRSTPLGMAGEVPPQVTQLQQNLARLENYTMRLITGAQMNQNEEVRIKKELPTMDLPPKDFWTRYDTARENVAMMERRILGLALSGNQQAGSIAQELGLNIPRPSTGQPRVTPEAPQQPTSPLSAPRRLRVRDKKTGRTGTMTLQPGEQVPEGVEVTK